MRLMEIPEWIDQAHTETNGCFKTSNLWSSLFKNYIVVGLLSQILGCRSSSSFLLLLKADLIL